MANITFIAIFLINIILCAWWAKETLFKKTAQKTLEKIAVGTMVVLDDKLVSFLYELMRDHVPAGTVEFILRNSTHSGTTQYSNGWLALYAEHVAKQLHNKE